MTYKERRTIERMMCEHSISVIYQAAGNPHRPTQKWFACSEISAPGRPPHHAWGIRPRLAVDNCAREIFKGKPQGFPYEEENCPGHVAGGHDGADPKVCCRCGVHVDSLRPADPEDAAP